MKTVCIIPARMKSSRFYGKPIAKILGHPMVEHVYKRVQLAQHVDEVYVATCDREIAEVVEQFGGQVIMTSDKHVRGTDRVAEAALNIEADIILNAQGDEPLIDPDSINESITLMKNSGFQCLNWITPINDREVFLSQNIVKTVIDKDKKILYFSRQPIPSSCEGTPNCVYKQLGVYFFRKDFLLRYAKWPERPLEQAEKVDMLRILEYGFAIEAFIAKDLIGVDTPENLSLVEQLLLKDPLCNSLFKAGCR